MQRSAQQLCWVQRLRFLRLLNVAHHFWCPVLLQKFKIRRNLQNAKQKTPDDGQKFCKFIAYNAWMCLANQLDSEDSCPEQLPATVCPLRSLIRKLPFFVVSPANWTHATFCHRMEMD